MLMFRTFKTVAFSGMMSERNMSMSTMNVLSTTNSMTRGMLPNSSSSKSAMMELVPPQLSLSPAASAWGQRRARMARSHDMVSGSLGSPGVTKTAIPTRPSRLTTARPISLRGPGRSSGVRSTRSAKLECSSTWGRPRTRPAPGSAWSSFAMASRACRLAPASTVESFGASTMSTTGPIQPRAKPGASAS